MESGELERSWEITRRHLDAARARLLPALPALVEGWSVSRYEDWISHNELELAFDELEGIGNEMGCGELFWSELLAAARNMSLPLHAARCLEKLDTLQKKKN